MVVWSGWMLSYPHVTSWL